MERDKALILRDVAQHLEEIAEELNDKGIIGCYGLSLKFLALRIRDVIKGE